MPRSKRYIWLKLNRFWGGLSDFPYHWLSEDLKDALRRNLDAKQPKLKRP